MSLDVPLSKGTPIRPIFDWSRSRMAARSSSPSLCHHATVTASIARVLLWRCSSSLTLISEIPLTSSTAGSMTKRVKSGPRVSLPGGTPIKSRNRASGNVSMQRSMLARSCTNRAQLARGGDVGTWSRPPHRCGGGRSGKARAGFAKNPRSGEHDGFEREPRRIDYPRSSAARARTKVRALNPELAAAEGREGLSSLE
jgi:hypothetical protein